jgi:bifunctional non-homologous end joining protein LigD
VAGNLTEYRRKRRADATPEPFGAAARDGDAPIFVVQRHSARRLHYDFRLERDGALASWAVPKGIPMLPGTRRLAVHVEDHPLDYAGFEGEIPAGQYGAGTVEIWDSGTYETVSEKPDGGLTVRLAGRRLRGTWALAPAGLDGDPKNWLIIRKREPDPHPWPDERYPPMLARLGDAPPPGDDWAHEIKWDGFRTMARLRAGEPSLWSRNDQDLTERFATVARRLERAIRTSECVLDGEVCALDDQGRPRFGLLQRSEGTLVYAVFDLLELEGEPVLDRPWSARRELLEPLVVPDDPVVRFSAAFPDGPALLAAAREQGLEGIVSKRRDSRYRPGQRTADWVKSKVRQEQELVIAGYRPGQGSRERFGALVVAVNGPRGLVWAGNVGTGFTQAEIDRLLDLLRPLRRDDPPLAEVPAELRRRTAPVVWVEPELVCQVQFVEWTDDGRLRAPVYLGLRDDKTAAEVVREAPGVDAPLGAAEPVAGSPATRPSPDSGRVKLTNQGKVFFPEEGITKGDLVAYYRAVAPVLVPHLRDRPFTMIRYPDGIAGGHFFQKDRPKHLPEWIPVSAQPSSFGEDARTIRYPLVNEADAVAWMVNAGCIDMNAWYSRADRPLNPDYVLFDLDPSEGTGFAEAAQVALLVREALELIGLRSYPKTSSARGLHVMVPIDPVHDYAEARELCVIVARALEGTHSGLVTTEWAKARRRGVLIDSNQIGYGRTISSVYSVRPRPGAPVSTPLTWDEVHPGLDPRGFDMRTVLERVERHGDLFAPVLEGGQTLGPALARLR